MMSAGCIALRVLSLCAAALGRSILGWDALVGIGKAPAESEGLRVETGARASRVVGAAMMGCIEGAAVPVALVGDMRRCGLSFDCDLPGFPNAERSRSRGNMA